MFNKSHLLVSLSLTLCCLTLACNSRSTQQSGATAVVNKIEDVATVERDENGHVSRVSLYGTGLESAQLDWPGEFTPAEEVVFQECPWMVNAQLEHLSGLPRLRSLKLIRVPISDPGLIALEHVEPLRELQLSYTNVTGKGLRRIQHLGLTKLVLHSTVAIGAELETLGELTTLTSLTVQCPNVSVADLHVVSALDQLESLDIMFCSNLTEAAIAGLGEKKHLQYFIFDSKAVNDKMLAQICRFKNLKELNPSESNVSDLGLEYIAGLPNLERLILYQSQVKGAGLSLLTDLKQLKFVMLYKRQVDEAGREAITELQNALPDCEVELAVF